MALFARIQLIVPVKYQIDYRYAYEFIKPSTSGWMSMLPAIHGGSGLSGLAVSGLLLVSLPNGNRLGQ
jgi:hypothetical protein